MQATAGTRQPVAGTSTVTDTPSTTEAPATPPIQAPPGAQATSATILAGATKDELDDLDNWYDHGELSARREQRNAQQAVELGKLGLLGYAPYAQGFAQQLPSLQAKIAALPEAQRSRYTGEAAAFTIAIENTADNPMRDQLQRKFQQLKGAVDSDYANVLSDPVLHTESLFNLPYGYAHLGDEDQQLAQRLEDARDDYHAAGSADERETIVSEVVQTRALLQNRIDEALVKTRESGAQQWRAALADNDNALQRANILEGDRLNGGDRATHFGSTAFKDELHARAFTEDYLRHPAKYAALEQWETDLKQRDDDANAADHARTIPPPVLPEFQRFTDIAKQPPLPNSQYGSNLLASYQSAQRRMVAGMNHISVQGDPGGPLYNAYVKKYSPPAPVWKQELDEIVCRVTTGVLPGVNMFTNAICPRSPLDDETRRMIDTVANAVGAALGVAFPGAGAGILTKLDPLESVGGAVGSAVGKLLGKAKAPGSAGLEAFARALPAALADAGHADPQLSEAKTRIEGPEPLPQSYAVNQALAASGAADAAGVSKDLQGNSFVSINGQNYYVQWDPDVNTYRAYSGNNPFQQPIPVTRNAAGDWHAVAAPAGLSGGRPTFPQARRKEIGDYIAAHQDESAVTTADRFGVSLWIVEQLRRERGIGRARLAPALAPGLQANIVADLKSGMPQRQAARKYGLSVSRVATLLKQEEIAPLPRGGGEIPAETRARTVADIAANPAVPYREIAARQGISIHSVEGLARRASLTNSRYRPSAPKVTADERQRVVQYRRDHPDERAIDLAIRFGRAPATIRKILNAQAAAPAPSAAFGSTGQQAVDHALRTQPDATYESVAQATHTGPEAVRDYAELQGLARGGPSPGDNVPPLPADLQAASAADVDAALTSYEPLTEAQKASINRYGSAIDPAFLAEDFNKPVWMVENYMKSTAYLAAAGPGATSPAGDAIIDELFGTLSDADRNVIDLWKDTMSTEALAATLNKPEKLVTDYLRFEGGPTDPTSPAR